jgi:Arc/MetJ-type ribon-helix-helix transcriptional regulator
MSKMRNVSLPEELCVRAEEKFRHRFESIDDVVTALLTELTRGDSAELDRDEQQIIEERLKGLGYI